MLSCKHFKIKPASTCGLGKCLAPPLEVMWSLNLFAKVKITPFFKGMQKQFNLFAKDLVILSQLLEKHEFNLISCHDENYNLNKIQLCHTISQHMQQCYGLKMQTHQNVRNEK